MAWGCCSGTDSSHHLQFLSILRPFPGIHHVERTPPPHGSEIRLRHPVHPRRRLAGCREAEDRPHRLRRHGQWRCGEREAVRHHRGRVRRRCDAGRDDGEEVRRSQGLSRFPQAAGRGKGHFGHHQRHAGPLAHARQSRGAEGRQRRLQRKAAHADHRRRQATRRRREGLEADPADRQPAAERQTVPPGLPAGSGRPARQTLDRDEYPAGRIARRAVQAQPRAERPRLGHVAGADAGSRIRHRALLHELPLLVGVQRRHDHRLGCPPQRHRALGDRQGSQRADVASKANGSSNRSPAGTRPCPNTKSRSPTPTA